MRRHLPITMVFIAVFLGWTIWQHGCDRALPDISIDGGMITARNQTADDWQSVRVWVNEFYAGQFREIKAGGFVRESVTRFVAGRGQKLTSTAAISSVVVLATTPKGAPVRVVFGKPMWH